MTARRHILSSSALLLLARLSRYAVNFFLTPYMLARLGREGYGLWAVMGSLLAYSTTLLDLGLGMALIKYVAEYRARHDMDSIRVVTSIAFWFYLAVGAVVLTVAALLRPQLVSLLNLSPHLVPVARTLVLGVLIYFVAYSAINVFSHLLLGLERMAAMAVATVAGHVAYAGATAALLAAGHGVLAPLTASFIQLVVWALLLLAFVRRDVRRPLVSPLSLTAEPFRRLVRFGGWIQIGSLANLVNRETDRVIIGTVLSVAAVASYELGNHLAALSRDLPVVFLLVLMPMMSRVHGEGDEQRLTRMHLEASKWFALASFTLAGYVIGTRSQLLRLWVGQTDRHAEIVVVLVTISYVVLNLTGVGTTMLRAVGTPRFESYYAMLGATLNIVVTVALVPVLGFEGVVLGTTLGTAVGSAYFLWIFHRLRGVPLWDGFGRWLWKLVVGVGLATVALDVAGRWLGEDAFSSRPRAVLTLAGLLVVYLVALNALLALNRFYSAADRRMLLTFLRKVRLRRTGVTL